jgi:hypothetical protein
MTLIDMTNELSMGRARNGTAGEMRPVPLPILETKKRKKQVFRKPRNDGKTTKAGGKIRTANQGTKETHTRSGHKRTTGARTNCEGTSMHNNYHGKNDVQTG